MANRKQFLGETTLDPDLEKLLLAARSNPVTEEQLKEQRVSFAFGNSPADSRLITKETVRRTSHSIRLAS